MLDTKRKVTWRIGPALAVAVLLGGQLPPLYVAAATRNVKVHTNHLNLAPRELGILTVPNAIRERAPAALNTGRTEGELPHTYHEPVTFLSDKHLSTNLRFDITKSRYVTVTHVDHDSHWEFNTSGECSGIGARLENGDTFYWNHNIRAWKTRRITNDVAETKRWDRNMDWHTTVRNRGETEQVKFERSANFDHKYDLTIKTPAKSKNESMVLSVKWTKVNPNENHRYEARFTIGNTGDPTLDTIRHNIRTPATESQIERAMNTMDTIAGSLSDARHVLTSALENAR